MAFRAIPLLSGVVLGTAVALFGYYLYIFDKYLPTSVITFLSWYHGAHKPGYRGGILADGIGMGKTVQTLVLIHCLLHAQQVPSCV